MRQENPKVRLRKDRYSIHVYQTKTGPSRRALRSKKMAQELKRRLGNIYWPRAIDITNSIRTKADLGTRNGDRRTARPRVTLTNRFESSRIVRKPIEIPSNEKSESWVNISRLRGSRETARKDAGRTQLHGITNSLQRITSVPGI